jgi:hypothetical protein
MNAAPRRLTRVHAAAPTTTTSIASVVLKNKRYSLEASSTGTAAAVPTAVTPAVTKHTRSRMAVHSEECSLAGSRSISIAKDPKYVSSAAVEHSEITALPMPTS